MLTTVTIWGVFFLLLFFQCLLFVSMFFVGTLEGLAILKSFSDLCSIVMMVLSVIILSQLIQ